MRWLFEYRAESICRQGSIPNSLAVVKAGEFAALGLAVLAATCIVIAAILFLRVSNLWKASLLVSLAVVELFCAGLSVRDTFRLAAAYPADMVALFTAEAGRSPHPEPVQPESRHVHGVA